MQFVRVSSPLLALTFCLSLNLNLARAQKPAPVENVSSFPPRTAAEEQKALHAPPGFEIQLVASEPEINKPLNLAFDDRGRLWVTSTVEYPYPAKEGTRPRDSVKILSNFRADGRAQKVETFADGLNIPIGLLPHAVSKRRHRPQHPQHLLAERHRRRRQGRYPRTHSTESSATATRTA